MLIGGVEKQQKLSEERRTGGGSSVRRSGKDPGDVGRRKGRLSGFVFLFGLLFT